MKHRSKTAAAFFTLLLLIFLPIAVSARAGGETGGGGGGGTGGGTGGGPTGHSSASSDPVSEVLGWIAAPILLGASSIVFFFRLKKKSLESEHLMSRFDDSDPAWRYADIKKRVEESFYIIQNGWSCCDLNEAGPYLSDELRKEFSIKLEWMKYQNRRNVLDKIHLESVEPVAVSDSAGGSEDFIWFYIRARMVDYIEDETNQSVLSGSTNESSFVEYWMYIREKSSWVLNRILQQDEGKALLFGQK